VKRQAQNESHTMALERKIALFEPFPRSTLAGRLVRAGRDAIAELRSNPGSYLQVAFSLDNSNNWVAIRLLRDLGATLSEAIRHPLYFVRNAGLSESVTVIALNESTLSSAEFIDGRFIASALTPSALMEKRRRRLRPVLATSAFLHSFLIIYLLYIAIVSPYAGIRIVNKPYRPFDPAMLEPLYYPPGMFRTQLSNETMSLEEIRARARKRQEQLAREREKAERERAEREKAEKEKAEKEKQIAEAKAAEEKKAAEPKPGGAFEFNEAALKDIVGKIYQLYQAGGLDVDVTNFSVMVGFKMEPDGSLSDFKVLKSSGSKEVDRKAMEVLWTIGESHALGTLSSLSSNSIRLDLNETTARLTITSFAPSADEAKKKATELNSLFFFLRLAQKGKNPDVAELLNLAKITSSNNRIDANLTLSRARAAELMRSKFGNGSTSNPN
jgi:hypothetical protein